ncbi:MAG: hypothetical protein R2882_08865 [Gemmatimonadales bacterium]
MTMRMERPGPTCAGFSSGSAAMVAERERECGRKWRWRSGFGHPRSNRMAEQREVDLVVLGRRPR